MERYLILIIVLMILFPLHNVSNNMRIMIALGIIAIYLLFDKDVNCDTFGNTHTSNIESVANLASMIRNGEIIIPKLTVYGEINASGDIKSDTKLVAPNVNVTEKINTKHIDASHNIKGNSIAVTTTSKLDGTVTIGGNLNSTQDIRTTKGLYGEGITLTNANNSKIGNNNILTYNSYVGIDNRKNGAAIHTGSNGKGFSFNNNCSSTSTAHPNSRDYCQWKLVKPK